MIAIRVDVNEHIASGHAMRCLSVADALFSLGEDVTFITSDRYAQQMIENRGFKVICLGNDWNDKDNEIELLTKELNKLHPNLLLIDSYQVTQQYLRVLKDMVKVAYIDDLNTFDYPVDVVINYSVYAHDLDYPKNKQYLLGMDYVPLRKQFDISDTELESSINSRNESRQILITTGAADPYHIASKLTAKILKEQELAEYRFAIIKGKFWEDPTIEELMKDNKDRIQILENVENMADIMLNSTMAVSAGGSTLYELCACCVPAVTFSYADNQLENVNGFAQRGIMDHVGDARTNNSLTEDIVHSLVRLHSDDVLMCSHIAKMKDINCRKGAEHLACELVRMLEKKGD